MIIKQGGKKKSVWGTGDASGQIDKQSTKLSEDTWVKKKKTHNENIQSSSKNRNGDEL